MAYDPHMFSWKSQDDHSTQNLCFQLLALNSIPIHKQGQNLLEITSDDPAGIRIKAQRQEIARKNFAKMTIFVDFSHSKPL